MKTKLIPNENPIKIKKIFKSGNLKSKNSVSAKLFSRLNSQKINMDKMFILKNLKKIDKYLSENENIDLEELNTLIHGTQKTTIFLFNKKKILLEKTLKKI